MLTNAPVATLLPVVDIERAREFYVETLGLSLNDTFSDGNVLLFDCGNGTQLGVYARSTPTTADHTAASWLVDDIEAEVEDLSSRGVTFEHYDMPGLKTNAQGIAEMGGGGRTAWFKDPEGNILGISQMS